MPEQEYKHVHLIGIGGIHMSAVAKLLKHAGIAVSGSDVAESAMTPPAKAQRNINAVLKKNALLLVID